MYQSQSQSNHKFSSKIRKRNRTKKKKYFHQKIHQIRKHQKRSFITNNLNDRYLTWLSTKCGPPVSYQPKIYSRFHFSLFNFIFHFFFWKKSNVFFDNKQIFEKSKIILFIVFVSKKDLNGTQKVVLIKLKNCELFVSLQISEKIFYFWDVKSYFS